jgi:hypothetical protein
MVHLERDATGAALLATSRRRPSSARSGQTATTLRRCSSRALPSSMSPMPSMTPVPILASPQSKPDNDGAESSLAAPTGGRVSVINGADCCALVSATA